MNYNKFNNNDYNFIKNIIKIASDIQNQYFKLYILEIEGKKDSLEYKDNIIKLKELISLEDSEYNKFNLNIFKCVSIIEYLVQNYLPKDYASNFESIIEQDYNDGYIRRIINILLSKINYNQNNIFPKELINSLNKIGYFEIDYKENIKITIDEDYMNLFLMILEKYIKCDKDDSRRDILIEGKYYTILVNKNIEDNFIDNNFYYPENVYLISRYVSDLRRINSRKYRIIRNLYGLEMSLSIINILTEIKDFDYDYIDTELEVIFLQSLLRASFILMDDNYIYKMNELFHEQVESESYLKDHFDDEISENKIINCFKKVNEDRKNLKILSLKP